MKASMIFSLVGLVAMTAASPVAVPKRNVATAASTVDDLMSQVQAITAQINKTIAAVPQPVSTADATKIANSIAPQMNQLQSIIAQATASIQSQSKRDVSAQDTGCSGSCLTGKASVLISEISGTIRGVVTCLGVNNVIAIVQPVLTQVTGLLGCLDKIVNGLAQTVGGLLNNLLGGLGLGDLLSSLLGGLLGGLLGNGGLLGGLLGGGSSSGGGGLLGILDANQQAW